MKFSRVSAALAAVVVVGLPVLGVLAPSAAQAAPAVSAQDKAWMVAAHQSNLTEIAAGKAAEQKATSSAVRQHGELFISDHTRLDESLSTLASKLHVSLPSEPNAAQQASLASVSAKSGSAFDDAWLKAQILGHRQAQAAGQHELAVGSNSQVLAADRTAAPVVASHLQMLLSAADARGIDTGLSALTGAGRQAEFGWPLLAVGVMAVVGAVVGLRRRTTGRPAHV